MNPTVIISTIVSYFLLLIAISSLTSRNQSSESFYTGDKKSPWFLVAFGMIGTSLSGVTFISIPGAVQKNHFSYMWLVAGYFIGYIIIAEVLLPLYYRLKLISIYQYLAERFGRASYQTGASFFLLSRVIGASFRLYLVADVLNIFIFQNTAFFTTPLPYWVSVAVTILLIWVYTFKGGIKTIVWTDTLQTAFMILSVIVAVAWMAQDLNLSLGGLFSTLGKSSLTSLWNVPTETGLTNAPIIRNIISGMLITVVMTGLDQDMMQKNLTIKTLKNAKKNMYSLSVVLIFVNLIFLTLGAVLYLYSDAKGIAIPERTDHLFPTLALNNFQLIVGVIFLLGVIAAAYSSADSALTALTTSFIVDILRKPPATFKASNRYVVHIAFSLILFTTILVFEAINDDAVITQLFIAAGYTYGPLLGLYAFGLFTKWKLHDRFVPYVAIFAPLFCYIFSKLLVATGTYKFGFEIIAINGFIAFLCLYVVSEKVIAKLREVISLFGFIVLTAMLLTLLATGKDGSQPWTIVMGDTIYEIGYSTLFRLLVYVYAIHAGFSFLFRTRQWLLTVYQVIILIVSTAFLIGSLYIYNDLVAVNGVSLQVGITLSSMPLIGLSVYFLLNKNKNRR